MDLSCHLFIFIKLDDMFSQQGSAGCCQGQGRLFEETHGRRDRAGPCRPGPPCDCTYTVFPAFYAFDAHVLEACQMQPLKHCCAFHFFMDGRHICFMDCRHMCLTFEYCILIMLYLAIYVGAPAQRGGCCEESRRGQSARMVGYWYRVWREQVKYTLFPFM